MSSDISPLAYASMLCESFKRSKSLISQEKVEELIFELMVVFPQLPDNLARQYIETQNKTIKRRGRKRKRRKKVIKSKKVFTEEEIKVKTIVDQWLEDFERDYCVITYPAILAVMVDMELNIGVKEALIIIRKIEQEGGLLYAK